jgi:predicted N-formylglutamate amidohydrolase
VRRESAHAGSARRRVACLVSCEHGGNEIPDAFAARFRGHRRLLDSHRGYDPGALEMARDLARALGAMLVVATVSRLLVELNRSPGRQFRDSPVMHDAPEDIRAEVCRHYYAPYRSRIEAFVADACAAGMRVVHVSSHSFTPSLDGSVRRADVGLLYDPGRGRERDLSLQWQRLLAARRPAWRVRRNYPYQGRSDGFTSYLRKRHDEDAYLGLELEVNQKHVRNGIMPAPDRAAIIAALCEALAPSAAITASDAR